MDAGRKFGVAVGDWVGVEIIVGITVGVAGRTMGAVSVGVDVGRVIVWAGVDGGVTVEAADVGATGPGPTGVASSPPQADKTRIINAAADSNLAGKVRTRIPTLP